MVKCTEGLYYNPEHDVFEVAEWCSELSRQDLADALSIAHAEKVKKDNTIRQKYEHNNANTITQEKSG